MASCRHEAFFVAICLCLSVVLCVCQDEDSMQRPGEVPLQDPRQVTQMIHPTMYHALVDREYRTIFHSLDLTLYKWYQDESNNRLRHLLKYNGSSQILSGFSAATNLHSTDGGSSVLSVGYISYEHEIEHCRKYVGSFSNDLFGRGDSCNKQVFRAYDLVKLNNVPETFGPKFISIGLSDTHICVMAHTQANASFFFDNPFDEIANAREISLPIDDSAPFYRIASVTMTDMSPLSGDPSLKIEYYDEAGGVYEFEITRAEYFLRPLTNRRMSGLTSVVMDESRSNYADDRILNLLKSFKSPKTNGSPIQMNGYDVMRRHFYFAFIESMAMVDGSVAFSRGLLKTGPTMRFINNKDNKWPLGLETNTRLVTVHAIEAYKYDGLYYYHIFDTKYKGGLVDRNVNYWWCRFNSTREAGAYIWPIQFESHRCRDYKRPYSVGRVPLDVVYRPKCKKVYAFYQHMFQSEAADKYFTSQSPFTVVRWMKFQVNAIFHQSNRLYLFGSANRLYITNEISSCDFQDVKIANEYYQSDLLLTYSSKYDGLDYSQRLPFFDSARYFDGQWSLPLESSRDIEEDMRLTLADKPDPSSNTTTNATPRPNDSIGNSMITIIIIAIILIGIIFACIYYFYFANATEDQPRQPRSVLRKDASNPYRTQQSTQSVSTTGSRLGSKMSSKRAAKTPKGSTISPTMTVRSSEINQLSDAKSASSPTRPPRSASKKVSAITRKSPKLKQGSMMKTNVKSVRSPGFRRTKSAASKNAK